MENNYLKIVFIIDESGSMSGSEGDVIGGFNNFVDKQKNESYGKISVSLYKFNNKVNCVIRNQPAADVKMLTREDYNPNNCTALYDAIGKAMNDTDKQIADLPDTERPNKVMIVIITDGQENASKEYTSTAIKSAISTHEDLMGWNFVFLGSGLDSFVDADAIGAKYRANTPKTRLRSSLDLISENVVVFGYSAKEDEKRVFANLFEDLEKLNEDE